MERNTLFLSVLFLLFINNFLVCLCNEEASWTFYNTRDIFSNNRTLTEASSPSNVEMAPTSTPVPPSTVSPSTVPPSTEEPRPITKPCDLIISNISNLVSNFYRCSIDRARPYRFCTKCVQDYKDAIDLYNRIDKSSESKNSTVFQNCKNLLMKSDYAPLIPSVFQNIQTLWDSSYCSNCYNKDQKIELNNKTVEFIDSFKRMVTCVKNVTRTQGEKKMCSVCCENYKNLNSNFRDIEDYSSPSICMDVMDMMNYTRLLWGQECGGNKTVHNNLEVTIGASISVVGITIIFYVCVYLIGRGTLFNFCKYKPLSNNSSIYRSINDIPGINTPSASSQRS
ncbi:osteopetrosis-associated transmembrane protein 1-like, partial [Argonauta hians]